MRAQLFYTTIIGLTSGIFLRSFFDTGLPGIYALGLIALALLIVWRLRGGASNSILLIAALFVLSAGVGMFRLELSESVESPLEPYIGQTATYEGVVVREPDLRESSQHLYIRESQTGTLVLVTADTFAPVSYGDYVTVRGVLEIPQSFQTETGRVFDYGGYLKAKGVREMISFGQVAVRESNGGNPIMHTLFVLKHAFMDVLEQRISEPAAGLGEGMLLGVKRALGEDLTETFRIAGIIHIVVLSGYNIMVVADSVMRVLGFFFFPRTRLILGILAIVLFALLVGLSATVIRASIMAVLVLVSRSSGKTYAVMRALCLTGALMLLHNPYLLAFDPGFQLSFLATVGLVLLSPQFELRFTRIPEWIRGHLATTLGTQLFVLPVLLFSMGTLSLVSVVVNVLVLPIVPFAMLATFIVGVLGSISETLGTLFGFGAYLVLAYIITIAELFAALPLASVLIPAFSFWFVLFMYVVIILWTWRLIDNTRIRMTEDVDESSTINDYEGWVIEEEKDSPRGAGAPRGESDTVVVR